ncbi:Histidine kinase [Flavobacterium longum]
MKSIPLSFLVIFLFTCCERQGNGSAEQTNDSIAHYGKMLKKESLAEKDRLNLNKKFLDYLLDQDNSRAVRRSVADAAENLYKLNDKDGFKRASQMLLELSNEKNDTLHKAKAYKNLGTYYLDFQKNDSSYFHYLKAEELALMAKDEPLLGNIYLDIAFIKLFESDFTGSEISASKALTHFSKTNQYGVYDAYNIIGVCSNELKNYERALEYHKKALGVFREHNLASPFHLGASSLNNIGYVYQNMDKDAEAIVYFEEALSDKTLFRDNPGLYAMLLDNLAYSKFKLRDLNGLPGLYERSLSIRDSLKTDPSGIILNKIHLSQLYDYLKQDDKALQIAKDNLAFAKANGVASDVLGSLKQTSIVDKGNAGNYFQEYIKLNDSVQQIERKAKDKFARIAYETNEIIDEKDKLEQQNRNLLYIFIGTLTIVMLLFVIRTQRAKNRELMLKQAQQKANEDIYNLMINQQNSIEESRAREKKRIAQELHDGVLGRLFGARLNLDSLNRQNSEDAASKRNEYLTELKNIEQDIREISHDLNREKHALISNFLAILNNLLEEQRSSFEPEVTVNIDDSIQWDELENTAKINLYRIIQECLQNINKYASAKNINLSIKKLGNDLSLTIADDGVGFSTNTKKKGIGLQNMVSRTQELNGTFDVRSKKGKGTTIDVKFPLHKKGE